MATCPGEVLVRFDGSAGCRRPRRAARPGGRLARGRAPWASRGLQLLELEGDETPRQAADRLNAAAGVKYAHPNYVQQMYATPNDPEFPLQWGASTAAS